MKKKKNILIVIGIVIAAVGMFVTVRHITEGKLSVGAVLYEPGGEVNWEAYLPETVYLSKMEDSGAVAIQAGSNLILRNGQYERMECGTILEKQEDGSLLVSQDGLSNIFGRDFSSDLTPEEAAEQLGLHVIVFEKKMIIFTEQDNLFDTFRDFYTLEYLSLKLKEADTEDFTNAFIQLPNLVTNNSNQAVYYSAPDLDLGLQTELYSKLLGESASQVDLGPAIVAGEGHHPDNHSIVRVFNRQQTCISQFLAFPADVLGGVQVAAGETVRDGGRVVRIAAAAFEASSAESKKIRVFDSMGNLCMKITPSFYQAAPYAITTGHFVEGSGEEYLLAVSRPVKGKLHCGIYSLENGETIKTFSLACQEAKPSDSIKLSVRETLNGTDRVIFFFSESRLIMEGVPEQGSIVTVDVAVAEEATGVYPNGTEPGNYVVTLAEVSDRKDLSFLQFVFQEELQDALLDVGRRENMFFWGRSDNRYRIRNEPEDAYVRYAVGNHIRTDIPMFETFVTSRGKNDPIENFKERTFHDYDKASLSVTAGLKRSYHSSYHWWEPCYTHRWMGNAATLLSNYKEDGEYRYIAVGRDSQPVVYQEFESVFENGTYADGILELEKARIYPLRRFLQELAVEFRSTETGEPDKLAVLEPIHESEISVPGSVGDYNIQMIRGFRVYLLELYGTLENINTIFETPFSSVDEIDPPRNGEMGDRGEWDLYEGAYFTQWSLYNRYILNKRILEAFRESLLAGFPPEAISSHAIPEGDAITGLVGQADERLSPIDALLSGGTAFGATRFGCWWEDGKNFLALAKTSGHKNISIGEYASLVDDEHLAWEQMQYLYQNGVRYVNVMLFPSGSGYEHFYEYDLNAISKLRDQTIPRPGYAGGTESIKGIVQNKKQYQIVQIGSGDHQNGLLKSINTDGSWEGTVYLVPFHSRVNVFRLEFEEANNTHTAQVKNFQYGDQAEITFAAQYTGKGNATAKVSVYHNGCLLKNANTTFQLTGNQAAYRYVFRNQLPVDELKFVITFEADQSRSLSVSDFQGTTQRVQVARKYFGITDTGEHTGGVSYDILTREYIPDHLLRCSAN